jgi:hypothetical protein
MSEVDGMPIERDYNGERGPVPWCSGIEPRIVWWKHWRAWRILREAVERAKGHAR